MAGASLILSGGWHAAPALAQGALPGERIRGRIAGFDGEVLLVATREGGEQPVRLPEAATVASLRRVALADLVPGTQLGVVAEPAGDGLRAVAVSVLPPTATRQFQAPWDLGAGSSMNNGPVEAVVQRASGPELVLTINGRSVPVRIDERSALVRAVPATREDLKPGAAVFVTATRLAGGGLVATRVVVEKDGVAPPS